MGLLKRTRQTDTGGSSLAQPEDPSWQKSYPLLFSFLADDTYEDGSERVRGGMVLFAEGDCWKCCLNDNDQHQSLWLTGSTMAELLKVANVALGQPKPGWRLQKPKAQPPKGRLPR